MNPASPPDPTLKSSGPLRAMAVALFLGSVSIAAAAEKTYRYFRFETNQLNRDNLIQLAEFTVSRGGTLLNLNNRDGTGTNVVTVAASSAGQDPNGAEGPAKAVDGNLNTKWLRSDPLQPSNGLVLDFGAPVTIDAYNFATANDSQAFGRTPVSWRLSGSTDGLDWTVLDVRSNVAVVDQNFTYQAGFTIPVEVPQVINFFSVFDSAPDGTPAIVRNGEQVAFRWDTDYGDTVTLAGGGDSRTEFEDGVDFFSPPSNSTLPYTLTVSKSGQPDVSRSVTVRTVAGGTQTWRYVRYKITQRRPATNGLVQVSEFSFFNGDSTVAANKVPVATATNPGGSNAPDAGEGVLKLIDGNNSSKWLDGNNQAVIFDFGSPQAFDRYLFVTGNDAPDRDPVKWTLEGSNDGTTFTLIENVNFVYPTPVARNQSTLGIPLPGASLPPLIDRFTGDTATLVSGDTLTLTYTTRGAAGVSLNGSPLGTTSGTTTVSPTADTTYTLTATSTAGVTSTATFAVKVISSGVTGIAYSDFSTAGQEIIRNGNASITNSRLRLTPAQNSQLGGAWFARKLNAAGGFEATFGLHLNVAAPAVNPPADGIAFIVQNQPEGTTVTGAGEGGLATNALNVKFASYSGGSTSLVEVRSGTTLLASRIVFDTPGAELIGLPAVPEQAGPPVVPAIPARPNVLTTLSTARPYRIRIVYVPGDLDVYFDGIAVIQNVDVNLQTIGAADAGGKSYFGFSGRTGSFVQNNDITDWTVKLGNFSTLPPFGLVKSLILKTGNATVPNRIDLVWNATAGASYRVTRSTTLGPSAIWETITTLPGVNGQLGYSINNSVPPASDKAFFRVEQGN